MEIGNYYISIGKINVRLAAWENSYLFAASNHTKAQNKKPNIVLKTNFTKMKNTNFNSLQKFVAFTRFKILDFLAHSTTFSKQRQPEWRSKRHSLTSTPLRPVEAPDCSSGKRFFILKLVWRSSFDFRYKLPRFRYYDMTLVKQPKQSDWKEECKNIVMRLTYFSLAPISDVATTKIKFLCRKSPTRLQFCAS